MRLHHEMIMPATSTWHYTVYGLHLIANRPIPALLADSKDALDDLVQVHFDVSSQQVLWPNKADVIYTSPGKTEGGEPFLQVWKAERSEQRYLGFQYTNGKGITQFGINRDGSQIWVVRSPTISFGDVITYLLGPVLGCLLRLRQRTCLHAGVVAVGERAIAILGPKGAGKSTLVAGLAHDQGLAVMSDDIACLTAVQDRLWVQPGYPRLRLWPQTIGLWPDLTTKYLPRILSITDKRFLALTAEDRDSPWPFHATPRPLAAVYVLGSRDSDALSISPLQGAECLLALAANVYPEYTLDATMRRADFEALGRLATEVPVLQVSRQDGLSAVPATCQAIIEDVRTRIVETETHPL